MLQNSSNKKNSPQSHICLSLSDIYFRIHNTQILTPFLLQVYSKEISKRMLETVKSRSATSPAEGANNATASEESGEVTGNTTGEDSSQLETDVANVQLS